MIVAGAGAGGDQVLGELGDQVLGEPGRGTAGAQGAGRLLGVRLG